MLGKNNPQIDIFTHMIFERLIPKDHLLVLINSIIDFSFVYDIVKDKYSEIGRKSEYPVMMLNTIWYQAPMMLNTIWYQAPKLSSY